MAAVNGVAVGVLSDTNDPVGRGRVRVRVPAVSDAPDAWAPVVRAPGDREGDRSYRVGDWVLVAFELGDVRKPYVLGLLWSGKDGPADAP